MKKMNRRDLCAALPGVAAVVASAALVVEAQVPSPKSAEGLSSSGGAAAPVPGGGTMGESRVIPLEQMAVRTTANGGESRSIGHGTLATGEVMSWRQSMQPAGATPLALHGIQHTELILIREGELEFQHEVAGETVAERVGAGGVIYIAFGTRHALKNVGSGPARYFVVAVGGDTK